MTPDTINEKGLTRRGIDPVRQAHAFSRTDVRTPA